jgi:hypothetical protein
VAITSPITKSPCEGRVVNCALVLFLLIVIDLLIILLKRDWKRSGETLQRRDFREKGTKKTLKKSLEGIEWEKKERPFW